MELTKMQELFKEMDADGNGALTKEEFVDACGKNQTLMTYLDIYWKNLWKISEKLVKNQWKTSEKLVKN